MQTVGEATPRLCVPLDTQLSACPVSLQRLGTKGADSRSAAPACVRARHRRFSCSAALTDTRYTKARSSRIRRGQCAEKTLMSARHQDFTGRADDYCCVISCAGYFSLGGVC